MTREEKIKAIYAEMANKEKTIWCKYLVYEKNEPDKIIEAIEEWESFTLYFGGNDYAMKPTEEDYHKYYSIKEIIWHPVMIGDALEVIDAIAANRNNARYERRLRDILMVWSKPRKPIDEQPDECIDYVYSLIQKD